jgi:hypothetical protein
MRTLIAIIIVVLMTVSSALARKAPHHHSKRNKELSVTRTDPGGAMRHPDDVALDRKIGSICRGC